jgi:methionine synthase I (cobalamin-dependent)
MSSIEEFQSALEAALMTGLPVCATMTFDTSARSMMGVKPEQFAKIAYSSDLSCYGANCGVGPAELMADYAVLARDLGVKIIGGCCGTTPIHIKAMAQAVQNRPKEAFTQERADHLLGLAREGVNFKNNSQETATGRTRPKRRCN